ncbi:MAG TPA: hypothetical protein VFR37_23070 [Longimicrobium sp.]|nr:hypothetical protein [Longimicrobium sp.]
MTKRSLGGARRTAALAATVLMAGCVGDGDNLLTRVDPPVNGGEMFTTYVALGNSITAGLQSGGINDSLQIRAYPVLLAERAGTGFEVPLIMRPGCPRPFAAPLGATGRIGTADTCVRINSPRVVHNLAVPGERLLDLYRFPSGSLASINTLLIGPRTQVRAMIEARPTFVSVWIGNNDALEAATSGILGPVVAGGPPNLTPLATFQTQLGVLLDSINFANPQGAMLVGVVDASRASPLLQPGAYFFLARDPATGRFNGKLVNNNCSPITSLGQPNPLAANMVSFRVLSDVNVPEINCDPAAFGGAYLLDAGERTTLTARVTAFNEAIRLAAQQNDWVYVDPNAVLAPFLAETDADGRFQRIRKCQLLATAATPGQFQTAVLNSCPVTGPTAAPNFFGSLMSFDGIHPSTEAHRVLAGRFAEAINTKYQTTLSTAIN